MGEEQGGFSIGKLLLLAGGGFLLYWLYEQGLFGGTPATTTTTTTSGSTGSSTPPANPTAPPPSGTEQAVWAAVQKESWFQTADTQDTPLLNFDQWNGFYAGVKNMPGPAPDPYVGAVGTATRGQNLSLNQWWGYMTQAGFSGFGSFRSPTGSLAAVPHNPAASLPVNPRDPWGGGFQE